MVGYPAEVQEVVLGANSTGEGGVLGALAPGGLLVDMTTSRPALAVELAARASEASVAALDAPVSGGDVGARNGTLSIMVGGDDDAFARARPLLELMGNTIVHQGPAGAGQHTKLTNQVVVAGNLVAVCEALLYATRAGSMSNRCWRRSRAVPRRAGHFRTSRRASSPVTTRRASSSTTS